MQRKHFNTFHAFPNFKLGKNVYKKNLVISMLRNRNLFYRIKILWKFKNVPKKISTNFDKSRDSFCFWELLKKYILFKVLTEHMEIFELKPAIIILETRNFATHSDFSFEIKNEQYAWTTRLWTSTWYIVSYSKKWHAKHDLSKRYFPTYFVLPREKNSLSMYTFPLRWFTDSKWTCWHFIKLRFCQTTREAANQWP